MQGQEVTEAAPEGAAASGTLRNRKKPVSTPDTKEATAGAPVAKERPSGEPSSGSGSETSGEEDAQEACSCEAHAEEV